MDYRILAERMVDLQTSLHQVPITQELSALDRGIFFALNYLALHGNTAYPKELSREMAVSSARIAALLNHLEEEKLIQRSPDLRDNRQIIVSLTDKGLQLIRRKREEIMNIVAETLADLGQEDAEAFLRIQERIVQNFLQRTREEGKKSVTAKKEVTPSLL